MKNYQVWALVRNERGEEVWQAATRKYLVKKSAQNVAGELWLTTRIEESEEEDED